MRKLLHLALILLFVAPLIPLTTASAGGPERHIVVFDGAVNEAARKALVQRFGELVGEVSLVNGLVVLLPPPAVEALSKAPGVVRVHPDVVLEADKGPKKPPGGGKPQPSEELPWGIDRIDAKLAWGASTGSMVNIAIVDTGIDKDHPDLAVNIKGGENFVPDKRGRVNPDKWDDDNGHGTHVAGTVAAIDNEIGVVGVAPTAYLYAVKVLDKTGSGTLSGIVNSLTWCINNGIQVVNMSLGAELLPGDPAIETFHDAVKAVYNAGIVQVASAGNNGGPAGNHYPAAFAEVTAVSATDSSDATASWSNYGPEVELAAPGVSIKSTYKRGGYTTMSGTSMAAPHVTGSAALVIASGITGVDNVRSRLQTTADDLGDYGPDYYYGYGLVDAEEAATGIQTQAAPRRPGVSEIGKVTITWAQIKNQ